MTDIALNFAIDSNKNPLDIAEQIAQHREWIFERPVEDELLAEIEGSWCNYRLWFAWQADLEGMMVTSSFEMKVPKHSRKDIYELLCLINERLWVGHFDISSDDGSISFRQGVLLKGGQHVSQEQMEELMDISVDECERFYPAFQSVIWGGQSPEEAIKFAMFETFGEA